MFTTTRKLLAAAGLAAMLTIGVTASAEGPDGERGARHHRGNPIMRIIRQLDLNDAQQVMVKGFKADRKAGKDAKHAQHEDLRGIIKDELTSGHPNAAVIHDAMDQLAALKATSKHKSMDNVLELYATFDSQQLAEFEALVQNPPERRREDGRRGRRR